MQPTYTHRALVALPATVHRYTLPLLELTYISLTRASVIPDPVNAVLLVDVPVIAVPEFQRLPRCPVLPVAPFGPWGPVGPAGPVAPCGPVAPLGPVGPWAPVSPFAPCAPVAPRDGLPVSVEPRYQLPLAPMVGVVPFAPAGPWTP